MRAGIAVDNWKLPIFRKNLTAAGYVYEDGGPLVGETTLLTVETGDMLALKKVLEQCQTEAARQVKHD